ncbi:MAG: hypothetical protein JWL59_2146 [Chthoniobacteraceae bacterium]|nr:hypothetical protein [Chthoniobacteraceae bacterium]
MKAPFRGSLWWLLLLLGLVSCGKAPDVSKDEVPAGALKLLFTYGSEKEDWVKAVTVEFNRLGSRTASGKSVYVEAVAKGSGELIDDLLSGVSQAHLASPASAAFIQSGNARARARNGRDLIGPTENLLLSPVVIAMWKPMAEAIGWGKKPVGWSDILALATNEQGWAAHGYPQWGQFKFGHTHPQFSNSGLISLFAEVYAASGKTSGLNQHDIEKTAAFLSSIEKSVVHYGSSTGFFGKKMFANGPEYLSASVLYENMVIESYLPKYQMPFPIVALYPKEGAFWTDHPVGIVQGDWVTAEQKEAAKIYIAYLLARPQQEKAMEFGFRPAAVDVPLRAPLDVAHGIDPREPKTTLEVPTPEIMDAIVGLWRANKKHSDIALVFDTSGSMKENNRISSARVGALELLRLLDDEDSFLLVPFSQTVLSVGNSAPLKQIRDQSQRQIESLFPAGGTALYDAISRTFAKQIQVSKGSGKISAIVVLTDGADTNSSIKLDALLKQIRSDNENSSIRVFTIGYDAEAQKEVLKKIADATQARFYEGNPQNIREVFKEIATFF